MQREKPIDTRRGRMEFMLACYKKHAYSWVAMKGGKIHE